MKPPQDKDLLQYYEWLVQTDGQGSGFAREVFVMPEPGRSISSKEGQQVVDICSPAVTSRAKAASHRKQSPERIE